MALSVKKRIVVIGAGFGGINLVKNLNEANAEMTLIDRNNYHLFQPLLYQVATAGLSPANIAAPIRSIVKDQSNTEVLLGEVTSIDLKAQVVFLDAKKIVYDYLVIATGVTNFYFGQKTWEQFATGLKSIEEATAIRRKILLAFERAEAETDPEKLRTLLNFVIIGGGPTGVEMAGAIAELSHFALTKDFRHIDTHSTNIYLVEAGDRLLSAFSEELSQRALQDLKDLGVEVLLNTRVTDVTENCVKLNDKEIKAATVVWGAGVRVTSLIDLLPVEKDKMGRIKVTKELSLPEFPNVFAIGDVAHFADPTHENKPLPGVAPVAIQQGEYLAKRLQMLLDFKNRHNDANAFHYVDKGNLATIGRSSAVGEFRRIKFTGLLAWFLWLTVHIYYLVGFRNRILVMIQWIWAYLTFQRGARLITFDRSEKRNQS